jgi:YD repeat-containing protein
MGRTSVTQFDADGEETLSIDAAGNTTSTTYDPVGNAIYVTTALGTTTNLYDGDGNVIETIDPLGDTTSNVYVQRCRNVR